MKLQRALIGVIIAVAPRACALCTRTRVRTQLPCRLRFIAISVEIASDIAAAVVAQEGIEFLQAPAIVQRKKKFQPDTRYPVTSSDQ